MPDSRPHIAPSYASLPTALPAAEMRARAEEYRRMAATARMVGSSEALLRLAARFEAVAAQEEMAILPGLTEARGVATAA